jgi:tetratricopeptide (TPR) repeat protein
MSTTQRNFPFTLFKNLGLALLVILVAGCETKKSTATLTMEEMALQKIDSLEKAATKDFTESKGALDLGIHMEYAKALEDYAYNHLDSLAPRFLFKSARISEEILKDKRRAISLYGRVYNEFADFKDRPMMLFYQGSAYHDLNDTTEAVKVLQFFIQNYPGHPFVDDAEGLIKLMRMTDAEREKLFNGDIPS